MSKRFENALMGLKDTYPSPDPQRREDFLNSLPVQEERRNAVIPFLPGTRKPFWYAIPAVAIAAVMLTVGIRTYQQNPPHQIPVVETTTTSYTETGSHETLTETVTQVMTETTTNLTTKPAPTTETDLPEIVPTTVSAPAQTTAASAAASSPHATTEPATQAAQNPSPAQTVPPTRSTDVQQSVTHRPVTQPAQTKTTVVTTGTTAHTTEHIKTTGNAPAEATTKTHLPDTPDNPGVDPVPAETTAATHTTATTRTTDTTRTTVTTRTTAKTTVTTRTTARTTVTTRTTARTTATTRTTARTTVTTRTTARTTATTTRTEPMTTTRAATQTTATTRMTTWTTATTRMNTARPTEAPTQFFTTTRMTETMKPTEEPTNYWTEATTENPATYPQPTKPQETVPADMATYTTAAVDPQYDKPETAPVWTDYYNDFDYEPDYDQVPWWGSMAENASDIIGGTIVNIRYTHIAGTPYTAIDVVVDHVVKGDKQDGILTVFEPGGYIPLQVLAEYDSDVQQRVNNMTASERQQAAMVYEKATALPEPKIGDQCLFFLHENMHTGEYFYAESPHLSRWKLDKDYWSSSPELLWYDTYNGRYHVTGIRINNYLSGNS